MLLYRGRECGSSPLVVSAKTEAADWAVVRADRAWLNGDRLETNELPERLAAERNRRVNVRLAAGQVETEFPVEFQIAAPEDVGAVDENLRDLADSQRLDLRTIEDFVRKCRPYRTAERYYDAFAQYFYGVLARERSPESDLEPEEYREKYNLAASVLEQFDTVPARTVSALIAFHFNQFQRAVDRGIDSPRLRAAAERMLGFLMAGTPIPEIAKPEDSGFDEVFADAETDRVLRWVTIRLDGQLSRELEDASTYVLDREPLDQVKLRVVLAEYHLRLGDLPTARRHAEAQLHNDLTEDWARSLRDRLDRESDG